MKAKHTCFRINAKTNDGEIELSESQRWFSQSPDEILGSHHLVVVAAASILRKRGVEAIGTGGGN